MRPHVIESRPLANTGSWSGDAVGTPSGIYGGPANYLPGSDAYRALEDDLRSSYLILEGGNRSNEFILELDEAPASRTPVLVRFEWISGTYLPGLETTAIRIAYGDGVGDYGFNATPIGPMQWETVISRPNPFSSPLMRIYTLSGESRTLHVWSVEVGGQTLRGLRPLRQRQSLIGGGSWPLRQRQNGAHSGSWPLRQRQIGA